MAAQSLLQTRKLCLPRVNLAFPVSNKLSIGQILFKLPMNLLLMGSNLSLKPLQSFADLAIAHLPPSANSSLLSVTHSYNRRTPSATPTLGCQPRSRCALRVSMMQMR